MTHPDDPVQFPWDELDSLENIDTDPWFLDDDSDDFQEEPIIPVRTSYSLN